MPDKKQQQKNDCILQELKKICSQLTTPTNNKKIWQWLQSYNPETQELFLSILLDSYPEISKKYDGFLFLLA